MSDSREAWERVLATIEADMLRSAALVDGSRDTTVPVVADVVEVDTADGLPADWQLPSIVELPPMESMPPVPPELSERILSLRNQILSLQSELAQAMHDLPRLRRRPRTALMSVAAEVPTYIDRRL